MQQAQQKKSQKQGTERKPRPPLSVVYMWNMMHNAWVCVLGNALIRASKWLPTLQNVDIIVSHRICLPFSLALTKEQLRASLDEFGKSDKFKYACSTVSSADREERTLPCNIAWWLRYMVVSWCGVPRSPNHAHPYEEHHPKNSESIRALATLDPKI